MLKCTASRRKEKTDGYVHGYKRVKGRSHTVEKRLNMHPHKPQATSQLSRLSHTYRQRGMCMVYAAWMVGVDRFYVSV